MDNDYQKIFIDEHTDDKFYVNLYCPGDTTGNGICDYDDVNHVYAFYYIITTELGRKDSTGQPVYEDNKFQLVDPHDGTIRYFGALDVLNMVSSEFTLKAKYQGVDYAKLDEADKLNAKLYYPYCHPMGSGSGFVYYDHDLGSGSGSGSGSKLLEEEASGSGSEEEFSGPGSSGLADLASGSGSSGSGSSGSGSGSEEEFSGSGDLASGSGDLASGSASGSGCLPSEPIQIDSITTDRVPYAKLDEYDPDKHNVAGSGDGYHLYLLIVKLEQKVLYYDHPVHMYTFENLDEDHFVDPQTGESMNGKRFYGAPIRPFSPDFHATGSGDGDGDGDGVGSGCNYVLEESGEPQETDFVMIFVSQDERNLFLGTGEARTYADVNLREVCVDHDGMPHLDDLADNEKDEKCNKHCEDSVYEAGLEIIGCPDCYNTDELAGAAAVLAAAAVTSCGAQAVTVAGGLFNPLTGMVAFSALTTQLLCCLNPTGCVKPPEIELPPLCELTYEEPFNAELFPTEGGCGKPCTSDCDTIYNEYYLSTGLDTREFPYALGDGCICPPCPTFNMCNSLPFHYSPICFLTHDGRDSIVSIQTRQQKKQLFVSNYKEQMWINIAEQFSNNNVDAEFEVDDKRAYLKWKTEAGVAPPPANTGGLLVIQILLQKVDSCNSHAPPDLCKQLFDKIRLHSFEEIHENLTFSLVDGIETAIPIFESFYLNSWFPPEDSSGGFGEDYPQDIKEYKKVCQTCTGVDLCDILPSIDPHSSATDLLRELAKDCEQAYEPENNRVSDPTSGILTSILYSDQDDKFYVRIVEYETYVNVIFRGAVQCTFTEEELGKL